MCTVKIQFVLWVAMETEKSHMTQMGVFLRTFFSHLVGPREQFGTHEKLSWGMQAAGLLALLCRFSLC